MVSDTRDHPWAVIEVAHDGTTADGAIGRADPTKMQVAIDRGLSKQSALDQFVRRKRDSAKPNRQKAPGVYKVEMEERRIVPAGLEPRFAKAASTGEVEELLLGVSGEV